MKKCIGFLSVAIAAVMLISCANGESSLEPHEISEIYGYTFYGNITASSGNTLTPLLILYNDERVDWNMSTDGMKLTQFYYFSVKNSQNNYTLYWFSPEDKAAAMNKVKEKAGMTVQLGIDSLNKVTILLTGDGMTGIGAMQNTRVPMIKQANIPHTTTPTNIVFDESIKDVKIEIPSSAVRDSWNGKTSYNGDFIYLVGVGGKVDRGKGSCGLGADGKEIPPVIGIAADGTNTVKITTHRFAYTEHMTINGYEIPGVEVHKDGATSYLHLAATDAYSATMGSGKTITLKGLTVDGKLEGGTLILRISFMPGNMPLPVTEVFTGK